MNLIESVESQYMKSDIPEFGAGDVVKVNTRIREGQKERIQTYEGTVIRRAHGGLRSTFTVRRVAFGAGSERTFPSIHPILRVFRSLDTVLSAARSSITYASVPGEPHESKNAEDNLMAMNAFELTCQQNGYRQIAGIDEAGRGALAGPVIAAAVILPINCTLDGLNDSKQLSPKQRERLYDEIHRVAVSIAVGSMDNQVIDRLNILNATLLAMQQAVKKLNPQPDYILVDGIHLPQVDIPSKAIPKGDTLSYSIAAASIIAKTTRDRRMCALDHTYPNYGFLKHKGYPTSRHRQAIARFGASDIHRHTFKLLPED